MKEIRIGVMGVKRGGDYVDIFSSLEGVKVTAVCDFDEHALKPIIEKYGDSLTYFRSFDEFIESGLFEGVMLANYFYEHTPFAIKAMEHGIHVLSECTPACTMAECSALCRAVERTGCKYMLAENYPFFACNLEMKRIFESGSLGKALYCEGEYNHPVTADDKNWLSPGVNHWRNWLPRSYYITHALAPILNITGSVPKSVNCRSIFAPDSVKGTACQVGDMAAIMLVGLSDGALARVTGCSAWGGHGNWYRICGERGNVCSVRGSLDDVRLQYNDWSVPEGKEVVSSYHAEYFNDEAMNEVAAKAGHGGGDFWVAYHFAKYLRGEWEPFFNVYRSVSMSATAILALRSSQNGGCEYLIPDFSKEEERVKWDNDTATPFPGVNGEAATIPCCSRPDYHPTEEDIAKAEKFWKEKELI